MVDFKPEDYEFNDESGSDSSLEEKNADADTPKRKAIDDEVLPNAKKTAKNGLYKQPTAEELTKLRETENLFNSNIFRLQIKELLDEIRIKPKYESQFEKWQNEFLKELMQMPESDEICLAREAENTVSKKKKKKLERDFLKFASTIDRVPCNQEIAMKFLKPKSVSAHGDLKNVPDEKTKFFGNLLLTMDKTMFFEKDYLNNKYLAKKRFYLSYIQHLAANFASVKEMKLKSYLGNEHVQYLEIVPTFSDLVIVNVFFAPEADTFKLNRFMPNKNNLKQLCLENFPEFQVANFSSEGTPLYNSVLLFDYTYAANWQFLSENLRVHDNIKDAIKLIIIWLRQRHLNNHYRTFTDDLVLYTIAYLLAKKKINKLMSSYQVVRIFWTFLSTLEGGEKLSIATGVTSTTDLELFTSPFVLLDSTGCYNVGMFLDENIFIKVKHAAKSALDSLDSNRFNAFSHLFTTSMPQGLEYDAILKIHDVNNFKKIYWNCSDTDKFKYFGFYELLIRSYIEKYLRFGLTNRIEELIPIAAGSETGFMYGINLNAETHYNVIEKGPRQFEASAEEFKEFWGELAELRRFKDSSIYEAVYFEHAKTIQAKRLIFVKIIEFVMQEKLEVSYQLNGGEMEQLLHIFPTPPFASGSNEEATLKIKSAQTNLDKILRNLKLPLPITAVQCTSDLNSYTAIFPPVPANFKWTEYNCKESGDFVLISEGNREYKNLPHLVEPIECVLQLALNSKWPKELQALRAIKTIYYYEIAKLIRLEHNVLTSVRDDFIDVFYDGYVFRLRLYHPKEIVLLKETTTAEGVTCYKDNKESLEMERKLDSLPKISGALNGLHQEHPSFGPSTCLIKRWMRSQMLDDAHISDVVISLLNASLFIVSEPYRAAILPQVAFIRFLKFIAEFDWNFQAVVVNFNNSLSVDELNEFDSKFMQCRQNYGALHIITPFDEGKSVFTKNGPTSMVMKRIKCLAMQTYKELLKGLHESIEFDYMAYFVPNLNGYNLLIHLHASANIRRYQQVRRERKLKTALEVFDEEKGQSLPVVGFEPVEFYLQELRSNYGDYALFFHDFYGGNVIGVLWKQSLLEEQDFKISQVPGCKLSSSNKLTLDVDALTEDFYVHGKGIVRTIEVVQHI